MPDELYGNAAQIIPLLLVAFIVDLRMRPAANVRRLAIFFRALWSVYLVIIVGIAVLAEYTAVSVLSGKWADSANNRDLVGSVMQTLTILLGAQLIIRVVEIVIRGSKSPEK